jgi:hypothetical protein
MNSSSKTYYTITPVNPQEASWQPDAIINNKIHVESGITSNWKYRQFLTHTANEIRQQNYAETMNDIGYVERYANAPSFQYTTPYTYKSYLDNTAPPGYEGSDLKEMYFSREELNARKVSPAITQDALINSSQNVYNK